MKLVWFFIGSLLVNSFNVSANLSEDEDEVEIPKVEVPGSIEVYNADTFFDLQYYRDLSRFIYDAPKKGGYFGKMRFEVSANASFYIVLESQLTIINIIGSENIVGFKQNFKKPVYYSFGIERPKLSFSEKRISNNSPKDINEDDNTVQHFHNMLTDDDGDDTGVIYKRSFDISLGMAFKDRRHQAHYQPTFYVTFGLALK